MTEEENKAMQMEYSQKLTTTGTISLEEAMIYFDTCLREYYKFTNKNNLSQTKNNSPCAKTKW